MLENPMQTRTRRSFTAAGITLLVGGIATRAVAQNDATLTHTFDAPGEVPYHCFLHRTMLGNITVA